MTTIDIVACPEGSDSFASRRPAGPATGGRGRSSSTLNSRTALRLRPSRRRRAPRPRGGRGTSTSRATATARTAIAVVFPMFVTTTASVGEPPERTSIDSASSAESAGAGPPPENAAYRPRGGERQQRRDECADPGVRGRARAREDRRAHVVEPARRRRRRRSAASPGGTTSRRRRPSPDQWGPERWPGAHRGLRDLRPRRRRPGRRPPPARRHRSICPRPLRRPDDQTDAGESPGGRATPVARITAAVEASSPPGRLPAR